MGLFCRNSIHRATPSRIPNTAGLDNEAVGVDILRPLTVGFKPQMTTKLPSRLSRPLFP